MFGSFFVFVVRNVREGHMAYNTALTKKKLRKWGMGDKIKFVDVNFKR